MALPPSRKALVGGTLFVAVAGLIGLLIWANQPDFQVLYSNLDNRDAAAVMTKLKTRRIPFELSAGGKTISVPSDKVYETRLALAGDGLPSGGGVGFEIFNETKLGMTQFVQRVNYQRALQGELARTIAAFDAVRSARVHIVMPRESLFVEEEKKPSAAVVLSLRSGVRLKAEKVDAIVHLVAMSIPALSPDRITVVDTRGRLLYKKGPETALARLSVTQLSYQRTYESRLRSKIQNMLDRVVGPGRAVTQVQADLDFTRTSTVRERFDPRTVLRSEQRTQSTSSGKPLRAKGSPDTRFRLADKNLGAGAGGRTATSSKQTRETSNFEVSKTRTRTVSSIGRVKKLSVAVVIDGPYREVIGRDGKKTRQFVGLPKDQMGRIQALVQRTMGYDVKRGDKVQVSNLPFRSAAVVGVEPGVDWMGWIRKGLKPALNILIVVLFFLFVVRPLLRWTGRAAEMAPAAPAAVQRRVAAEIEPGIEPGLIIREEGVEEEELVITKRVGPREKAKKLSDRYPDETLTIVRAWLREGS